MAEGSLLLRLGFVGLTAAVVAGFVSLVARVDRSRARAALGASLAWVVLTGLLAAAGALSFERRPPTMPLLFVAIFALVAWLGAADLGRRLARDLPLALLVGFQGFRVVVELLMHRAYTEGLMPVQMSYEGRNFDIVAGASALVVAAVLIVRGEAGWPRRLAAAWNVLGICTLLNVLAIALLSAPTPLRRFFNEPANTWVTRAPWVWLPAVFVLAAALGHVLLTRRLLARGAA